MNEREKYERTLKHIQYSVYPATLASVNLVLYQFIRNTEQQVFYRPEIMFLASSVCFFLTSIFIGVGLLNIEAENENGKLVRVVIGTLFFLGMMFQLLGILVLISLSVTVQ